MLKTNSTGAKQEHQQAPNSVLQAALPAYHPVKLEVAFQKMSNAMTLSVCLLRESRPVIFSTVQKQPLPCCAHYCVCGLAEWPLAWIIYIFYTPPKKLAGLHDFSQTENFSLVLASRNKGPCNTHNPQALRRAEHKLGWEAIHPCV